VYPDPDITADDLAAAAPEIRAGDVVLVRTGWSDQAWGDFPRYCLESPACTPDAARWLVDTGAKSIWFDCFPERAAKKQGYLPYELVIHQIVGDAGAILRRSLTNLGALPTDRRFPFHRAFLKVAWGQRRPASPSLTELPRPGAPADKGAFGPIPLPERPYLLR
jgi:kynurenine formamidase